MASTHILIILCLNVAIFGFILYGISVLPPPRYLFPFLTLGSFQPLFFSNVFLIPCSASSLSGIPIMCVGTYPISLIYHFHFFFTYFSIYCSDYVIFFFVILSCRSLILMHHPVYYLSPLAEVLSLQMSCLILIGTSIFSTSCSSFFTVIYIFIDSLS